jgi:hypothetical protein
VNFAELEDLRTYLASLKAYQVPTMNHYVSGDKTGFWHQVSKREQSSLSSTATCVSSLARGGNWSSKDRKWGNSRRIALRLLRRPWKSAGLQNNNSFSVAFIAQGVLDLTKDEPFRNSNVLIDRVRRDVVPILKTAILTKDSHLGAVGSVSIDPYPPSAYLTQLAYRVLTRLSNGNGEYQEVRQAVRAWARSEVYRQLALIDSESPIADPLQLAYSIILLATSVVEEFTSPEEKALVRQALKTFFAHQRADGTWPPSQPLFHYPKFGNALCFDYELLAELLWCGPLRDELLIYLPNLKRAALHLDQTYYAVTEAARGWASGHHPQIPGPESWSTACVFDFIAALDRLVAEAIREALFSELRAPYKPPTLQQQDSDRKFGPGFLDAHVKVGSETRSLKTTLFDYFVDPIDREASVVARGGKLSKSTPMSAIFYGPPGTSKTQLAKLIGEYLGWPSVVIDPSYVVQDGLDRLYARASHLFSMLSSLEQVVVLLDEFDELGRDRANETEVLSRFITTSMLPKLAAINDQRKAVFLLATNYLSRFDAAFRRGGRFDMLIQIMQPTVEAKLANPEWRDILHGALQRVKGKRLKEANEWLGDLTYLETEQLVLRLQGPVEDAHDEIKVAHEAGTLMRVNFDGKTWKTTSQDEADQVRLPAILRPVLSPPLPLPGFAA